MALGQCFKWNCNSAQAQYYHRWEIPGFGSWLSAKNGNQLEGEIISPKPGIELQLRMKPTENKRVGTNSVGITNCGKNEVTLAKFSLRLEAMWKRNDQCVPQNINSKVQFSYTIKESMTIAPNCSSEEFLFNWHDRRSGHWKPSAGQSLQDDTLVVYCVFGLKHRSLVEDLEKQLSDLNFTDWTLVCEDQKIPCHRFLLGARSPVFRRMFEQTGFTENKTCQTEMEDLSLSTLRDLIKFIYTDKIDPDNQNIPDLFVAADKYDIQELRSRCEVIMMQQLNIENCVEYFRLAYLHGTGRVFREKTIELITANFQLIKSSPAFIDMQNERIFGPALVEIMDYFYQKLNESRQSSKNTLDPFLRKWSIP